MSEFYWPEVFTDPNFDKSKYKVDEILAMQLVGWGLVQLGLEPPTECDFYDEMDAMSKITGAFTGTECSALAEKIILERKKNGCIRSIERKD